MPRHTGEHRGIAGTILTATWAAPEDERRGFFKGPSVAALRDRAEASSAYCTLRWGAMMILAAERSHADRMELRSVAPTKG